MNKPLLLILLLMFAFFLGSLTTGPARSQQERSLAEETPAPQPVDTAAAKAAPPAARAPAATLPASTGAILATVPPLRGGITEWFSRGGAFMWPILVCSIIAAIFILERAYTLIKARTNTRALMTDILNTVRRDGVTAAERVCEQTRGPIAAIVHSGLRQADKGPDAVGKAIETAGAVEMSFLERGLIWLATISTVAPLLGFLGTISGMIHAFDAIAAADQVSAKLVAGGISDALIPTGAGLIVAIPASLAHNFFLSQIDRFVVEMEESSSELVNTIVELR